MQDVMSNHSATETLEGRIPTLSTPGESVLLAQWAGGLQAALLGSERYVAARSQQHFLLDLGQGVTYPQPFLPAGNVGGVLLLPAR